MLLQIHPLITSVQFSMARYRVQEETLQILFTVMQIWWLIYSSHFVSYLIFFNS